MSCEEYWATPEEYADFWCVDIPGVDETDQVKHYIRRASSTINMALRASGACDCTIGADARGYLRDLTIVSAVVYHGCPCARPRLTGEQLKLFADQVREELRLLRQGMIEVCDGHTGSEFPAIGYAQQSWTNWAAAEIVQRSRMRELIDV